MSRTPVKGEHVLIARNANVDVTVDSSRLVRDMQCERHVNTIPPGDFLDVHA
jgi:hypothetical protein